MKSLIMFLSLVFVTPNLIAEENSAIDFNKINQVISQMGASLIEGDELFTELTAGFDPAKTNLTERKVAGDLLAAVRGTAWAQSETSLRVMASAEKIGESTRNGEEMVDTAIQLGADLTTPVVSLVQFGWQKFGCPTEENTELISVYSYLQNQVCPMLNEAIPALTEGEELVQLIDQTVVLVKTSIQSYLDLMTKKLNETEDSELKSAIEALLYQAKEVKSEAERLVVTNNGSSIELSISFEELLGQPLKATIGGTVSGEVLGLDLGAEYGIYKDSFEELFSFVETVLMGLQNENEEVIADLQSTLKGYLEMVKSIISE